jgi:hypothetical protein
VAEGRLTLEEGLRALDAEDPSAHADLIFDLYEAAERSRRGVRDGARGRLFLAARLLLVAIVVGGIAWALRATPMAAVLIGCVGGFFACIGLLCIVQSAVALVRCARAPLRRPTPPMFRWNGDVSWVSHGVLAKLVERDADLGLLPSPRLVVIGVPGRAKYDWAHWTLDDDVRLALAALRLGTEVAATQNGAEVIARIEQGLGDGGSRRELKSMADRLLTLSRLLSAAKRHTSRWGEHSTDSSALRRSSASGSRDAEAGRAACSLDATCSPHPSGRQPRLIHPSSRR